MQLQRAHEIELRARRIADGAVVFIVKSHSNAAGALFDGILLRIEREAGVARTGVRAVAGLHDEIGHDANPTCRRK